LNYRHAYHAGNFADVFKHLMLVRMLLYLRRKEAPFRVIDTHAGLGFYRLDGEEARKTGEADGGIRRFAKAALSPAAQELAAPYLALARPGLASGGLYPGSPAIAADLLREQDRMTFAELHPRDAMKLRRHFARDRRVAMLEMDGFLALKAGTPPRERRGLVLIDPPFESPDEFERVRGAVLEAHAKWPTGCYAIWYPVKADGLSERFLAAMRASFVPRQLCLELMIAPRNSERGLPGCGLLVINPPFSLREEAGILLPELAVALGGAGAECRILELVGEMPAKGSGQEE
jgi:23S rRNA (adenine2030-N6)-methyltransferase